MQGRGRKREAGITPCVQGGKIVEDKWNQKNTIGWFVFPEKPNLRTTKRTQFPLTWTNTGEHNMFHTMIPWLCVRMGLWCNKICINNIKWRFKTISFCDPRPFKASWCKLITSGRISVPLWFFLTQIGSEIYFGLCHMSFLPYFYFFITHPCMILLGRVSPDSIKFHYGNGGLGNRGDQRGCLCLMLLLLLQYSKKHTFMQGGVMCSGCGMGGGGLEPEAHLFQNFFIFGLSEQTLQ